MRRETPGLPLKTWVSISSMSFSRPDDHRGVAVDDLVEDRVEDGLRPEAQQVGVALHAPPHAGEVRGLGVPQGDHEVRPHEDVQLPELHLLGGVDVPGGAQDHEEGVVVALELGPLVGDDRVLDGQFVQAELLGQGGDIALVRPVHADPGHALGLGVQRGVGLGEGGGRGDAVAVDVDGAVDEAAALLTPGRGGGAGRSRPSGGVPTAGGGACRGTECGELDGHGGSLETSSGARVDACGPRGQTTAREGAGTHR